MLQRTGTIKRKSRLVLALALLAALAAGAPRADAEQQLLAEQELALPDGAQATAELWGDVLPGGYARELLLLLKSPEKKLTAAWQPDIAGGYTPYMEAVRLRAGKGEQLLLTLPQGDWRAARQVRVLDFADPAHVEVLLTAADNLGIIRQAALAEDNKQLELTLADGSNHTAALQNKPETDRYGTASLDFGGFHNVTAVDMDGDGVQELLMLQRVQAGGAALADVGSLWRWQGGGSEDDKAAAGQNGSNENDKNGQKDAQSNNNNKNGKSSLWDGLQAAVEEALGAESAGIIGGADGPTAIFVAGKLPAAADAGREQDGGRAERWQKGMLTLMTSAPAHKQNKVNEGAGASRYKILPRPLVLPGGEANFPQAAVPGDAELQNAFNATLAAACAPYLEAFAAGREDTAFQVLTAADKLLSLEIIHGKDSFKHHYINIDPQTGRLLRLRDVLELRQPGLKKLLAALNTNKKLDLSQEIPEDWYLLEGDKLYVMREVDGREENAGFALGNLHKYLRPWLRSAK